MIAVLLVTVATAEVVVVVVTLVAAVVASAVIIVVVIGVNTVRLLNLAVATVMAMTVMFLLLQ